MRKKAEWKNRRSNLLLLFWPIYFLGYYLVESVFSQRRFHVMVSPLDALFPFSEWFVIPYVFWYFYLGGMVVYTFFCEPELYERFMIYLILTTGLAFLVFLLYPSCQNLRPEEFPRSNGLTRLVALLYHADTDTNVCPSLHVMHALGIMTAGFRVRRLQSPCWQLFFIVTSLLIIVSTVMIKQHSVLDVAVALPLCAAAEWAAYERWGGFDQNAA